MYVRGEKGKGEKGDAPSSKKAGGGGGGLLGEPLIFFDEWEFFFIYSMYLRNQSRL